MFCSILDPVHKLLHLTPMKREHVETSYISELQSEIQNNCNENMTPETNVPLSSVKSEIAEVVSPLQDNSSLHNVLANVSKSININISYVIYIVVTYLYVHLLRYL